MNKELNVPLQWPNILLALQGLAGVSPFKKWLGQTKIPVLGWVLGQVTPFQRSVALSCDVGQTQQTSVPMHLESSQKRQQ